MIVTCENCNSRFNLDENLIKESGSKVKCSKCHHIFTVHKLVPVEEPAAEEPAPVEEEVAIEETPEAAEEAPEEALDLDLSEAEEKPAEEEIAPERIGLEEEPAAEEPAPVEQGVALEKASEAVEGEPVIEEAEAKTEFEDLADAVSVESLEGAKEEETEQVERKQKVQEVEETPMSPLVAEKEPQARRRRISTPLMIVLALVLLAGGAFAAYSLLKTFDIKIPFLESLTGGPESGIIDPGNLRIALLDKLIKSDFVDNSTAGRLFVIKGKVRNDYPEARNFIMVKGVLYSKDGKPVDKKTIYCGNTLSGTDLQALDKVTMDGRLRKRSSFSVLSGKVIPFLVVFSDLPQDLGEFSVEVVSSAPG